MKLTNEQKRVLKEVLTNEVYKISDESRDLKKVLGVNYLQNPSYEALIKKLIIIDDICNSIKI